MKQPRYRCFAEFYQSSGHFLFPHEHRSAEPVPVHLIRAQQCAVDAATPEEFLEAGDHVVALGYYTGRAKKTGKTFKARFVHVWTVRDGLIIRLQQCTDTVQLIKALEN